ncbi:helix-turn-helix transcriptional regulator [Brevibacterium sp. 91QC2O2]|uniref:helix-turn-helix transcriptional regulator n=1 Tax=Brevibacterium sp. 91QC2O2 TaxID=2968458 RepID=UPI00211BCE97|nr:helix-turn-helix transcriptional regulator [Brevibacterium sp. 91QC2O2]MCQ9367980.1 helix-turn-helix transcriptional regulator [Brevibacterium sp. 91QC2O2]
MTYQAIVPMRRPNKKKPKARYNREVYMEPIDRDLLRELRDDKGYTQGQLAMLCQCSQATISALERGVMKYCTKDLADTIAKWLGRKTRELFIEHGGARVHRVTNARNSKRQSGKVAA